MKLKQLIDKASEQILSTKNFPLEYRSVDIKGLSLNSQRTKKGDMFFCLSGSRHKGSEFVVQAHKNGARALVADEKIERRLPKGLLLIRVKDARKFLGVVADIFFGRPLDQMNSVAVTGTNGKTSVTFIIEKILKTYKKQAGVIGTINYRFAQNKFNALNTTPDILTAYAFIAKLQRKSIKYFLMEVSSHALAQERIEGLKFDQAIFTNLSQDHFDYHKTKSKYFAAKSKLFTDYLKPGGIGIINIDDEYGKKLIGLAKRNKNFRILTYGIKTRAEVRARDIELRENGSIFTLDIKKRSIKIHTNLIGLFNIYNILAAVASCFKLGVPLEHIRRGLEEICIPGRLELVSSLDGVKIFVDYAHTEDALKNVLYSLRGLRGCGRIILVFGCGGNRDRDKRHKMGRVASALADLIVVTSDNPRFEDPRGIISDIKQGIKHKRCLSFIDRRAALEKAIEMSKSGDIILIAGKGHEDYQIIKHKKLFFNDRLAVKEILSKGSKCLN